MSKSASKTAIPPLIKRNTAYLASSQAFNGAGQQMVPTLGPVLVTQMIGSAALAGIGSSITGLSRLIVAYPIGRFTDAYGRRAGVVLAYNLTDTNITDAGATLSAAGVRELEDGLPGSRANLTIDYDRASGACARGGATTTASTSTCSTASRARSPPMPCRSRTRI